MDDLQIRLARLDDAAAVSQLFRQKIEVWQRINPQGQVENLPYESLTIYERWTHGGPWMSIETAAIYLSHLLRVGCLPFVAARGSDILGYVEVYPGSEPAPFNRHLHLMDMLTRPVGGTRIQQQLLQSLTDYAEQHGFQMLTISFSAFDQQSIDFFKNNSFTNLQKIVRYNISAQTGQGFYKAIDHTNADASQISGWYMSVGKQESARSHWEMLWPQLWAGVDQLTQQRAHHVHITASGHQAFAYFQQHPYDARSTHVYLWSPRPLTPQLLTAIRDWTHRQSYRTLVMDVPEETAKVLGTEAESTPQQQVILGRRI